MDGAQVSEGSKLVANSDERFGQVIGVSREVELW